MKKYSFESIQKALKESGLKLKDCLESVKLPVHKYYYEKQKHDKRATKSKDQFIAISPEPIQDVPEQLIVEYPNGVKLHIGSKAPIDTIRMLIHI
ncbi:MAG: hypothetical protein HOP11_02720 [Saprospiraceae bacterium]|nr:hypothetical protein [Saprospiraceae bacterium]